MKSTKRKKKTHKVFFFFLIYNLQGCFPPKSFTLILCVKVTNKNIALMPIVSKENFKI